jgi:hypothetical protein
MPCHEAVLPLEPGGFPGEVSSVVVSSLKALLLLEISSTGVEHHGLDIKVLGVILPVALLRILHLHLQLPCNAQKQLSPQTTRLKWNNRRQKLHADLIHSKQYQRTTAQSLIIGGFNNSGSNVHLVHLLFVRMELATA